MLLHQSSGIASYAQQWLNRLVFGHQHLHDE